MGNEQTLKALGECLVPLESCSGAEIVQVEDLQQKDLGSEVAVEEGVTWD